ncbi:MAG: U4/U6.U5 snRNP associated protein [Caeruleum heppii]|nr:MAG: U4/U6.U5 snRNP associated protein [Caeruleum heppii]
MPTPNPTSDSSKPSASTSNDTSFRRTWDVAAYAQKASDREAHDREIGKARYEAKLAGKKWHDPPKASVLDGPTVDTTSRASRLDVAAQVGKTVMLTGAMASTTGKRGRGAGFYCGDCDLTFKDNLQWVEHLNSKQHLVATGQSGEVRRATVEEVRERLRVLGEERRRRLVEEREGVEGLRGGLEERLKRREVEGEREREERRRKRREVRERKKDVKVEEGGDGVGGLGEGAEEEGDDMARMMGFGGFGTTKV